MKLLIDADACPVTRIAEEIACEFGIPCVLLCDTNHILSSTYSTIKVIDAGVDAVDIALINLCAKGDIVITQDYGVAAMALGRGAYALHQNGKQYTEENIEGLLMARHISGKERRSTGKSHIKGPKKRNAEDDRRFSASLTALITEALSK